MLIQFYSQGMFWLHVLGLKKVFCSRLKAAEKETSKTDHKFKNCRDRRVSRLLRALERVLRHEQEDLRDTRSRRLSVGRVHVHGQLQLDVLRAVKRNHQQQRHSLRSLLETKMKKLDPDFPRFESQLT